MYSLQVHSFQIRQINNDLFLQQTLTLLFPLNFTHSLQSFKKIIYWRIINISRICNKYIFINLENIYLPIINTINFLKKIK